MFFMERFYLPRLVGNTLGVATLALAGFTVFHALDSYGDARFFEGQAEVMQEIEQYEAASRADKNIDQLQTQVAGNVLIALGFISISSLSFYLTQPNQKQKSY